MLLFAYDQLHTITRTRYIHAHTIAHARFEQDAACWLVTHG